MRGSTWAGATHPSGVSATAGAALVTPAHALPETKASTGTVLAKYRDRLHLRPKGEQP
jgi:hypothetical protein